MPISGREEKVRASFCLSLELPLISHNHEAFETAHEIACQFGLGYQILDDLKDRKSDLQTECSGNIVFALGGNRKTIKML